MQERILRVPGAAARIKCIKTQLETNFYSKAHDPKSIFDQVRYNDDNARGKQVGGSRWGEVGGWMQEGGCRREFCAFLA